MPTRELNTALSTFSFPEIDAVTKPPQWHADMVAEIGADGILGSHIHNIHPQTIASGGLLKALLVEGTVTRLHESWRSRRVSDLPKHFAQTKAEDGTGAAIKSTIQEGLLVGALPHISNSLRKLARTQRRANSHHDVVVHPEVIAHPRNQWLGGRRLTTQAPFKELGYAFPGGIHYQPTAELLQAWGIPLDAEPEDISDMMKAAEESLGLANPVIDLGFIGKQRDGKRIKKPAALIRTLGQQGRIAWMQLGWRPDLCETPEDVAREWSDVEKASGGRLADTEQGQWLKVACEAIPNNDVLGLDVEVSARTLAATKVKNYIKGNQNIIQSARELV